MKHDLSKLKPDFQVKAQLLLDTLEGEGVIMRPYFTSRDLQTQARFYRQSRTWAQVEAKIRWLKENGADLLAEVLEGVGPCHGKWVTNALPGYSWHQWGEAVDCFLVNPDGSANWDGNAMGYHTYAQVAADLGLTAGGHWKSRDSVHVQLRGGRVRELMTPSEVSALMLKIWQS